MAYLALAVNIFMYSLNGKGYADCLAQYLHIEFLFSKRHNKMKGDKTFFTRN